MAPPAKKKKRIFLWAFLAVQAIFIVWTVAGLASGTDPASCNSLDAETCKNATNVGKGIAVVLIIVMWMVVDFLLVVVYASTGWRSGHESARADRAPHPGRRGLRHRQHRQ